MSKFGGLLRFLGFVPIGFSIATIAFVALLGTVSMMRALSGPQAGLNFMVSCAVGLVILGFGTWFGLKRGRRGILLGMLLGTSLIFLLFGSCFWGGSFHPFW